MSDLRNHDPRVPSSTDCPFCVRIGSSDLTLDSELCAAFADAYPVNPGHTLVVPRRHIASYFELTRNEQLAMCAAIAEVQQRLARDLRPAGYNVGINVGAAAGQTVAHAHVHVIPRFAGDVDDPRGGVRWVIPARAPYWNRSE